MASPIAREVATFDRELPALLANPEVAGRYVLIHGDAVAGFYDTFDEGLTAGYDRFEFKPFIVQRVAIEKPRFFPRTPATWH